MKNLSKAAVVSILLAGLSMPVLAQVNTNTTIQEGQVNTNATKQKGRDNDNVTVQRGGDNLNRTRQRGEINTNATGQTGGGYNDNATDQGARRQR
ncbi:hypothetical protein [Zoogloea sp.]|uniref:hypothetical protein n=1 Tax=Zoogloea sp. TaxID=49181 RepID=UPI0026303C98|nr:hypothetical protein [Zoogloea sp.]MDD3353073.1 hypothetical protein [Zoogloea sp.]